MKIRKRSVFSLQVMSLVTLLMDFVVVLIGTRLMYWAHSMVDRDFDGFLVVSKGGLQCA